MNFGIDPNRVTRYARLAGAATLAGGGAALLGWWLQIDWLVRGNSDWLAIAPLMAACLMLLGASLWLRAGIQHEHSSQRRWTQRASASLATLAILIGATRIAAELFNFTTFDMLGFTAAQPARMTWAAALNVTLFGSALLLAGTTRALALFQTLILCGALIAAVALTFFLFGGMPLLRDAQFSLFAAIGSLLLASGIYCTRTDGGLIALIMARGSGGSVLRRLLLPVLLIPLIVGWLRLQAQHAGWVGTEDGLAAFALSNVLLFAALIWLNATWLQRGSVKRRATTEQLERMTRLYSALSQVNQAIVWSVNRDELFDKICRVLIEYGGFRMAWIGLHDDNARRLIPVARWGDDTGYIDELMVYTDDRPEGRGPSGTAVREGRHYVCNDLLQDPNAAPWRAEYVQRNFRASAAFPIRLKDRVCGTLNVYAEETDFFQAQEIALLAEAATDISFALDNLARAEEHQLAEQAVQNEKAFSETMIDSMPGILYFYDTLGRFLRWNKNFETVSGYSHAEIADMHPLDFFAGEHRARVEARIGEVFEMGESDVVAPFVTKGGVEIPYFFTGRRVRFQDRDCLVGVGIDISEQQRAEQALRDSEQRLRTTLDNMLEACQLLDFNWRYLYLNRAASVQNRRANQELLGRTMLEAWPGIDATPVFAMFKRCMDERIPLHQEVEFSFPDGHQGWFDVRAQPTPDGIFVLSVEITERRLAEKHLHELNESLELKVRERTEELSAAMVRAEAADRLKSAFLATMSHELRTPLNSIIGFTGIVLQGLAGPLTAEQSKQLGMVKNSARHLLDLINDVLDISKIEAGQLEIRREPFELSDAITRVTAAVQPLVVKKNLVLHVVPLPTIETLTSDRRRLEQILLNLLNNAIKFTDRGSVTLAVDAVSGFKPSPDAPPCAAARIRVIDTGIGIKSDDMPKLFQPFRQIDYGLERQHEGTGLGLAICRRLTTLLGGEIEVKSVWSEGSEFSITVPLQAP